jgi:lipopolysaccharide/colanic/teichoic acid biosynthesis glycosyltransferase
MNRAVEIVIVGFLIAFTLPLMALISLAIKLDSPGPVLSHAYLLRGKGSNGTPVLKFRTTPHEPRTVGRGPRRTRVGQFLYFTRVDELPLLFNIVRGDLRVAEARSLISAQR